MARGEEFTRRILAPLRPRVSLGSGSALVLLTLFLPIGYQSCGPETKGFELLQGQGDWPTFLGIYLSDYFGPAFYGVALLLAAWTAVSTLISLLNPAIFRNRSVNLGLFAVSGTVSLFLISDSVVLLPWGFEDHGAFAVFALIIATCLAPVAYWPRKLFAIRIGLLIFPVLVILGLDELEWRPRNVSDWFVPLVWAVYALVPLALWWLGLSQRRRSAPEWAKIRRGLIAFYALSVLGNLCFCIVAWREGVWGFVPCCLGIHLMALGYMRLVKEGERNSTESMPGGP